MGVSTAPAVKAELLSLLRADLGLTGVQIDYADPGAAVAQEQIYFARTNRTAEPAPGMRGTGVKRREKYDIECYVGVAMDGDDAQAAEERCWAIVGRVEVVVGNNNSASGALGTALVPGGWVLMTDAEMIPFSDSGQRCAVAVCKIHAEANI